MRCRHGQADPGRQFVLADGLKRPKEGRKIPGVKSLHQDSRCNAKASFIMGHSLQAAAFRKWPFLRPTQSRNEGRGLDCKTASPR